MGLPRRLEVWKMGIVNYSEALKLQEKLSSDRKTNQIADTLLSLQHPPTYTLGKRRTDHNILVPESKLKSIGATLHYTQRGGDVTFHGQTGETGVWVGQRKIGAIGVRISSGITSHGLAFNVDPDLNYFKYIVPCGIVDKEVTSLQRETLQVLPSDEVVHDHLISCFVRTFGYADVVWKNVDSLP
ncbi:octanoyltransferase LIP2, mitochondrial isoform X3 [Andrographis paniculata]|uniref:octanoyltransferase LIP2, mitochondrial isoform X3 n=1 Tax=Andrographis paniculata TaxID=175694 RepID=UPI0021E8DFC6|nr:octanoyltransferase LIP2, mitochondrial isoform X3 [Andrographis paniculata]